MISVCSNTCKAHYIEREECAEWFGKVLEVKCSLAREVGEGTFANEAPLLLINSGSVRRLNKLGKKRGRKEVSELSFRPNLVVDDGSSGIVNVEDSWTKISIGNVHFEVIGPCSRCNMVEVGGGSGVLRTLSEYRRDRGRILFGVFVAVPAKLAKTEHIKIGDAIDVFSS